MGVALVVAYFLGSGRWDWLISTRKGLALCLSLLLIGVVVFNERSLVALFDLLAKFGLTDGSISEGTLARIETESFNVQISSMMIGGGLVVAYLLRSRRANEMHVAALIAFTVLFLPMVFTRNVDAGAHPMYSWVARNTPVASVFFIPFANDEFRFWAERSPFLSNEDNAAVLYSEDFATEFVRRLRIAGKWEDMTPSEVQKVASQEKVDYVLTEDSITSPEFALAHREFGLSLYKVSID